MNPFLHPIWWLKISNALGRQDHGRVIDLSMKVLRKKPDNFAALRFAATSLESMSEFERGKEFAHKALAVHPGDFDLRCALVRMLNPAKDCDELLEQARWLVALSGTTLPQDDLWSEKAANMLDHFPISAKLANAAKQDIEQQTQEHQTYLRWAKGYLARQDELMADSSFNSD